MKNILLDFSSIKTGGGAQLASSFLSEIANFNIVNMFKIFLLLPSVGPLISLKDELKDFQVVQAPKSNFKRVFFEYFLLKPYLKDYNIDLIFTFFGPGLPHNRSVKSIVSTAYPIICYPESQYWKHVPFFEKRKKLLWNFMRCHRLKSADLIIAETEVMKKRLVCKLGFDPDCVDVIPPAVSSYIKDYSRNVSNPPSKFLVLSNNSFHKNLRLLLGVAEELEKCNDKYVKFFVSISRNDFLRKIHYSFDKKIIDKRFSFLGSISPDKVYEKYIECDALINISDLESFSNNYMEAWKTNTLLIVSDRDFAKSICGNSALYVDPYKPKSVVNAIFELRRDVGLRNKMIDCGKKKLEELPSMHERNDIIIKKIQKLL